jgi:hypothetical protein
VSDEQVASAPTVRQGPVEERLPAGTMAGEYRIEDLVGGGAMGDVYRAIHPQIGKRVAVKVIKRRLAGSEEAVERFVREARLVNKIDHPNVVDVFAMGRLDDGRLWLGMDFLDGESLGRKLRRDGALGVPEMLGVLRPVCEALAAAHAKNVVHRDLKSDNIFLGKERVYVLDFGIAKLLAEVAAETGLGKALTSEGAWIGTPAYMAPEQWTAEGASVASDVYALGVVGFEALAGRPPFFAPSVPAIMEQHFRADPPALSTLGAARVPAALEAAIRHALAKKPEDRPAGALAFFDELERAAGGAAAVSAWSLRRSSSAPRGRRVSPTAAILAAVVVACALAAAVFVARRSTGEPSTSAAEIRATQVVLSVNSKPSGAEVRQGDRAVGRTPLILRAPKGEQVTIVVEYPGYAAATRSVEAAPDAVVEVTLDPVRAFEGVWQIPGGEYRMFRRDGELVAGFALEGAEGEPEFLRNYSFLPAPAGAVAFTGSHEHVDERAASEPSCHIRLEMQYRYQPASDKLELRKQQADYAFEGRRCILRGDLDWGEFEAATRISHATLVTRVTAPGGAKPQAPLAPVPKRQQLEKKKKTVKKAPDPKGAQLDAISPPAANAAPPPAANEPGGLQQQASEPPPQQSVPFTGAKSRKK